MTRKTERVNRTLQREIGALITETLRDPRLPAITSVTHVECSPDMSEARVSVSVLGTDQERTQALAALESAAGVLRRALVSRIRLKQIPRLHFRLDATMQKAADMFALMDRVAAEDRRRSREGGPR